MQYDLKTSSEELLLLAADIIIMRKQEYKDFLEVIESASVEDAEKRLPYHLKLWYDDGVLLSDFDEKIYNIYNEIDNRRLDDE